MTGVIQSFGHYLKLQNLCITRAEFEKNLYAKLQDRAFMHDLKPVLPARVLFDPKEAAMVVYEKLIKQLSGKAWKKNKELMLLFSSLNQL